MDVIATIGGWIESWMNQRGGGDNWDWNHTNSTFSQYYGDYGLNVAQQMSPYTILSTNTTPMSAYSASYGPNDVDTNVAFDHSYQSTDQFTWTMSEGLSTTVSSKVTAGVPDVFSAEVGVSFTVDITATQAQTTTETTTWTQTTSFVLPAHETATVTMIVNEDVVSASANVTAVVSGTVAAGLNNRWNGHYFWWVPITELAQQFNSNQQISIVGNTVVFTVPVSFNGQAGVASHLQITTGGASTSALTGGRNFITHPATLVGRSPSE